MNSLIHPDSKRARGTSQSFSILRPARASRAWGNDNSVPSDAKVLMAFTKVSELKRDYKEASIDASPFTFAGVQMIHIVVEMDDARFNWFMDAQCNETRTCIQTWERIGEAFIGLGAKDKVLWHRLSFENEQPVEFPAIDKERGLLDMLRFVSISCSLVDSQAFQKYPWTPAPMRIGYASANVVLSEVASRFVDQDSLFRTNENLFDKLSFLRLECADT
jgi:hypothetical protein